MISGSIFKKIGSSIRFYPWVHLSAFLVLTSTLTIILSLTLFFKNLEGILVSWGSQVEMNIYLADNLKKEDQQEIHKTIVELGHFKNVQFITKESAIDNFFSKMSKYVPDFAEDKEFLNVIPASYLATLEKTLPISEIASIGKSILKITGVEDVSYGQEWIENFSVFLSTLKNTSWFISLVLAVGGIFVIGFIIYILINKRREEIEIYELCGATSSMIQAPFIVEGAILCLLSSVLALVFSFFILVLQNNFLHSEMIYFGLNEIFHFFSLIQIVTTILTCTLIGGVVSYLFVRKMNSGWAAASRI